MRRRAFTLIEILIVVVILGILAAIVLPKFVGAADDSVDANLRTQLRILRTQIELYRVKNFVDPNLDAVDQWNDLIQNDYIHHVPINPLNGSSLIATNPTLGAGWVWRLGPTGVFVLRATDRDFNLYVE